MTIFSKPYDEVVSLHMSLIGTYNDEHAGPVKKQIAVRAGYLGLAIISAIIAPVYIAINLIAYTFNLLSLGLIEPLETFTNDMTVASQHLIPLIFTGVMGIVNPGSQLVQGPKELNVPSLLQLINRIRAE